MRKIKSIYFTNRFYVAFLMVAALFVLGNFFFIALLIAKITILLLISLLILEIVIHFNGGFEGERFVAERFSNGDNNKVHLNLISKYGIKTKITIIDEIPMQFQKRDFHIENIATPAQKISETYFLRPVERGEYHFGKINVYAKLLGGLINRRFKLGDRCYVKVYPSFYQLKKIEMIAFTNSMNVSGLKRIKRIGNNREFEQIKEYVSGDDYRKINWKATARQSKLMVNEYQEERSQHVYQIIDMGRTMQMPFENMTLLDYSINSALAIANVILKKHDKTGLLTYSDSVHSFIKSANRKYQINTILETLYNQQTLFKESNLEKVFLTLRNNAQGRSLLVFYTNYESILGLERQLPILKKLASSHLVLLVSFINTELTEMIQQPVSSVEDIYFKTLAEKNILERNLFMEKLTHFGILNLRTKPSELTISVLNKYLEIKNRGLL